MAQPPKDVKGIVREGIASLKDRIDDGFRSLKADLDIQLEQDRRSGRDPHDFATQITHLEDELQQCRDENRENNKADPILEAPIQSLQEQNQKLKDRAKNKGNWTSESAPKVRLLQAEKASLEGQLQGLRDQLKNAGRAETVKIRKPETENGNLELDKEQLTRDLDALQVLSSSIPAAGSQDLQVQAELDRLLPFSQPNFQINSNAQFVRKLKLPSCEGPILYCSIARIQTSLLHSPLGISISTLRVAHSEFLSLFIRFSPRLSVRPQSLSRSRIFYCFICL